jgi:hypothetical protein
VSSVPNRLRTRLIGLAITGTDTLRSLDKTHADERQADGNLVSFELLPNLANGASRTIALFSNGLIRNPNVA